MSIKFFGNFLFLILSFIKEKDITIEKDDSLGDYIYLTENLAKLPGSKYSKKRNHINQFRKKHENFRFELLSEENLFYAEEIENAWLLENLSDDEKERHNLEEERKIIFFKK